MAKRNAVVKQYGGDSWPAPSFGSKGSAPSGYPSNIGTPQTSRLSPAPSRGSAGVNPPAINPNSAFYPGNAQRLMSQHAASKQSVTPTTQDPTQYRKSLQDFIAQARQLLASQGNDAMSQLDSASSMYRGNADQALSQTKQGYDALSAFIKGQDAPIASAYQTGIDQTGGAMSAAQQAIISGNEAAQAQQQAILSRLGIQDANIPIANNGTTLEAQMAHNIADNATRGQAAQTRLAENSQTARNSNTAAGTAAALEGQGAQNSIIRELNDRLSSVSSQRATMSGNSEADALALAQQLYNNDYGTWSDNYGRQYQTQKDAISIAQSMQGPSPTADSTTWGSLGAPGQAAYVLENAGVDSINSKAIIQTIQEAYANGRLTEPGDFVQAVQKLARDRGLDPIDTDTAASVYWAFYN